MMTPLEDINATNLGAIGIFIILILREFINLLKWFSSEKDVDPHTTIENSLNTLTSKLERIDNMVRELHDWHNKEDDEGVKIWYVRKSLESAITELSSSVKAQTTLFHSFPDIMEALVTRLNELSNKIKE